ncbi:HAD family hydrolase [Gaetbulibacter aestuarii]|uniref:HAD family phosphatase n=1 Tax=Gaetbulibacter aestuarii TaxID=1502358 RepID=A0ABW7N119_9FLAO
MKIINNIIFDLGGVLIDWNPEYVFLDAFDGDREKTTWFLNTICTSDWNENQDAGYPLQQATEDLVAEFPDYEKYIRMFYGDWPKMLGGSIDETVSIFKNLKQSQNYKIVALTNWSSETFPIAKKRFDFLDWFDGIVVSGEEKVRKPFKKIYEICLNRFDLKAESTLFIDDNLRNIKAAEALKINGIHYKSPQQLKNDLKQFNILIS